MELPISLLNHHPGSEGKNDIHLMLCHRKSHVRGPRAYSGIISLEVALEKQAVLELDLAHVLGLVRVENQDQHHHQQKVTVKLKRRL